MFVPLQGRQRPWTPVPNRHFTLGEHWRWMTHEMLKWWFTYSRYFHGISKWMKWLNLYSDLCNTPNINFVVVSKNLYVYPYPWKWSNLTNIFQMGWNHQARYKVFAADELRQEAYNIACISFPPDFSQWLVGYCNVAGWSYARNSLCHGLLL